MEARVEISETYLVFQKAFGDFITVLANLSRTAMLWLRQFIITSILWAHIIEEKLKILGTNKKSEETVSFYLIFCAFGHFYWDVLKRKYSC